MLVGHEGHDDAGVYLVRPDLVAVQSIDVFGPVVDDPYDFGRVAAANALSDLWAMGVEPAIAVAFLAFPPDKIPLDSVADILRGGRDTVDEAGASIIGGHTIRDVEPKYGLAVTGFASPDAVWSNGGARPGDAIVLTKPLGSGVLTTALKAGELDGDTIASLTRLMTTLNRGAYVHARAFSIHGATDVTGFGLLGHLLEMADASGLSAHVDASCVPLLDAARELAEQGRVPGGTRKNLAWLGERCVFDAEIPDAMRLLLADAQTSGGLLLALPKGEADQLVRRLDPVCDQSPAIIGRFEEATGAPCVSVTRR